ncbi:glycosyltransferase [Solirubrobacter ginsenosidimutans]|uniref:Glycosyltransferase n=1 Tax=Solirubrobacter ginsenosidimutans TaxID=490573 RepID=A0A9X3MXA0_9ACTN|nr:glycosyltransferase [Solirubrobacter ginsenosidimutans]MDA0164736.1 glycosyltransferase [Solirubrobacter ginsenosidimutans]
MRAVASRLRARPAGHYDGSILGRGENPYPLPSAGVPIRIAFVGQSTYFEACVLESPATVFVEFREGADADAMRARVAAFAPDVVVVFRPELLAPGVFADLRVPVIGFLTEPIPRRPARRTHPDLLQRGFALSKLDPNNVDRLIAFDPLIVGTVDPTMRVWRSLPLPVADRLYAPVRPYSAQPSVLLVGRSTPYRERFLVRPKAELTLVHAAFGIGTDELARMMAEHDIAVNLHNEPYPSFENRVSLHLAAGQLVVSETLSPTHGLEPDIDYLEFATPEQFLAVLRTAVAHPRAYERVRHRGRRKAEAFRASRVYPRLIADLYADLRAFGTERTAASHAVTR